MNSISKKFELASKQRGMTLVELLVVLAIFFIVAGLTIFDYGRFRSSVSLQNLADDIALSIRRAQNYAIGVKSANPSAFDSGYGIHFSTNLYSSSDARAGSNKSFVIFADLDGSHTYNYTTSTSAICDVSTITAGEECVDLLSINTADSIYQICPDGNNCVNSGFADITFLRPNPDAFICVDGACSSSLSSVDIVVRNTASGDTKTISVSNIGQISIR